MSSTDGESRSRSDERGRAMLQRFFEREILPLAKSPGWERSDTAPDPALASYWKDLGAEAVRPVDFELAFGDPDSIAKSLDRLWRDTVLAGLGRKLARLARRFDRRQEKSDVSSDVYEMF